MSVIKKIAIITSGGDCGGLNAVVKGAGLMANAQGIEAYIIPKGYAGLYNLVDYDKLVRLDDEKLDAVSSYLAGSIAGHSRVKISKIENPGKYERIKEGLKKFGVDGLVIAGGDDTGGVVVDLVENGIPCIHAPKTMDLDLHTYSVGGDSAVNRIARFIEEVKTTGRSHNRVMIIEVFGRYSGHTAFRGGLGGDADCILIPEIPVDFHVVYEHMKTTFIRRARASDLKTGVYVIVVSEAFKTETGDLTTDDSVGVDAFGHKKLGGSGKLVRQYLTDRIAKDSDITEFMKEEGLFIQDMNMAPEVRETVPNYLIRSGYSTALDVNFGKEIGGGAVLLLLAGVSGVTVSGVNKGEINYIPTAEAIKQRNVDLNTVAFYEKMGVCFGRKPVDYKPRISEARDGVWTYLS